MVSKEIKRITLKKSNLIKNCEKALAKSKIVSVLKDQSMAHV